MRSAYKTLEAAIAMLSLEECTAIMTILILKARRKKIKKRKKSYKTIIHLGINEKPNSVNLLSPFKELFWRLRKDEEKFFNYFQMSIASFDELHEILKASIQKKDTRMKISISSVERLAVTLRYLATGDTLSDLHRTFKLAIATISYIIEEACFAIWLNLEPLCLPNPTEERWLKIEHGFAESANFPNCIGAIDGRHIHTTKPSDNGLILLGICDSQYLFSIIEIRPYQQSSDTYIFENSNICKLISSKQFHIPPATFIHDGAPSKVNHVFVGDEAFNLHNHVMRPFAGKNLSQKQKVFNYRLSRARRYIDCTFAILTNKWRILQRPLNVSIEFSENIVKTCVLLHNFVMTRDGYKFEDTLCCEGLESTPHDVNINCFKEKTSTEIRNTFADYFVGPGEMKRQYIRI